MNKHQQQPSTLSPDRQCISRFVPIPDGPPTITKQQGLRFSRNGRCYPDKRLTAAETLYKALFIPHRLTHLIGGAMRVTVIFIWPHKRSAPKRLKDKEVYYMAKPDLDNTVKLLLDSVADLFFTDDKNITELSVSKRRGPQPGVYLCIEGIGDEEVLYPVPVDIPAGRLQWPEEA